MSKKLDKSGFGAIHLAAVMAVVIILACFSGFMTRKVNKGLSGVENQILEEHAEKFREVWNEHSDEVKGKVRKLLSDDEWKGLVATFVSRNETSEMITAFISTEDGLKICPPDEEKILCILTERALNSFLPPNAKVADVKDLDIGRIDKSKFKIYMEVGITGVSKYAICDGIVNTKTMELKNKSVKMVEN